MPALRHDCGPNGEHCFNRLHRPKIEVFDECFGRGCAFGDVDGVVENRGWFLFLEWKKPGARYPTGQRILHEQLTLLSPQISVVVVHGDAESMAVESIFAVRGGQVEEPVSMDLDALKNYVRRWWARADRGEAA